MALAPCFWNAIERRYGTHQCSGTPCPSGSSPMEVARAGKRAFQRLAHFRFICCFGCSIKESIIVARLNSMMLAASFHRCLGMCPHGPQSGGQALTRAMTEKTERQRARLKARTRCHSGNKLRLRDIIVRMVASVAHASLTLPMRVEHPST